MINKIKSARVRLAKFTLILPLLLLLLFAFRTVNHPPLIATGVIADTIPPPPPPVPAAPAAVPEPPSAPVPVEPDADGKAPKPPVAPGAPSAPRAPMPPPVPPKKTSDK